MSVTSALLLSLQPPPSVVRSHILISGIAGPLWEDSVSAGEAAKGVQVNAQVEVAIATPAPLVLGPEDAVVVPVVAVPVLGAGHLVADGELHVAVGGQ